MELAPVRENPDEKETEVSQDCPEEDLRLYSELQQHTGSILKNQSESKVAPFATSLSTASSQ